MENNIVIENIEFEKFITQEKIIERISSLAESINRFLYAENKETIIISVLNGSFMFTADIVRKITFQKVKVIFVKLKSYSGIETTGIVKTIIGLDEEIKGKNVIIVEDIVDTGTTIKKLYSDLLLLEPNNIKIATLLFKPDKYTENIPIEYLGFEVDDNFVVGYGLDLNGYGRNLKDIYKKC